MNLLLRPATPLSGNLPIPRDRRRRRALFDPTDADDEIVPIIVAIAETRKRRP